MLYRFVAIFALVIINACVKQVARDDATKQPDQTIPITSKALDTEKPISAIVFGSCYAPQLESNGIWNGIQQVSPDLLLLIGDNVYQSEEKSEPELVELREAYSLLASDKEFKKIRASIPVLSVWDDHDYGLNDAGGDWPIKTYSERLFEDVWAIPVNDPRRSREGIYHAQTIGPVGQQVQIIILDTRFFRSPLKATDEKKPGKERYIPDDDPSKTMLGKAQWQWLGEQLSEPADIRILVSSVQVISEGHGFEAWKMLPIERQKLYQMIDESKANGVVFISGDRHFGGFYREHDGLPYPITEVTSSPLNIPLKGDAVGQAFDEQGPKRLGPIYTQPNFGHIQIDWQSGSIEFQLRDTNSQTIKSETIRISDLQPKPTQ